MNAARTITVSIHEKISKSAIPQQQASSINQINPKRGSFSSKKLKNAASIFESNVFKEVLDAGEDMKVHRHVQTLPRLVTVSVQFVENSW